MRKFINHHGVRIILSHIVIYEPSVYDKNYASLLTLSNGDKLNVWMKVSELDKLFDG